MILDTHVFLWMNSAPEKLAKKMRLLLENPETKLYFSAASALEISLKHSLNKLALPASPESYVLERIKSNNLIPLPITLKHSLLAGSFSVEHRDPFDRLLAAQAITEQLPLLTVDEKLGLFSCPMVWAQ